jgi:SAM-dependent MidA family methyltransferase
VAAICSTLGDMMKDLITIKYINYLHNEMADQLKLFLLESSERLKNGDRPHLVAVSLEQMARELDKTKLLLQIADQHLKSEIGSGSSCSVELPSKNLSHCL